jgi:hypothetical protein
MVQGLELGFLIRTDHVVVIPQGLALTAAGVEIQDAAGLWAEVRILGIDLGAVLPELDRILIQPTADGGQADGIHQMLGHRQGPDLAGGDP